MKKVLCVCLGNTCRSPMMASLLQDELGDKFMVESAGLRKEAAGQSANEHSKLVMSERGVDLSSHVSRFVGDLDLSEYVYFVCVGEAEAKVLVETHGVDLKKIIIPNKEDGGVLNPFQKGLEAYRVCLALLDKELPMVARKVR